ncbi:MAG: class I SAM-dependent methyltransferase [Patescibacteria group bacterium]
MTQWSHYYARSVDADLYIRQLYGQKEFLQAIVKEDPRKVAEIGAGTGIMSVFLSHLGIEVTTLDNDPAVIEQAKLTRSRFGGNNKLVEGDAFQLPFPDNSFDVVFHQGLLEHFSDEQIQELIREHLRVAPVVWASVPNNHYPNRDLGNERLLGPAAWAKILHPFTVLQNRTYAPKIFPKWYLPRVNIQYMAKIIRG